ncbi:MAG: hypothetical protein PHD88_02340 [Firmicutes bacterium]|nr:hypothetical protein [Bacillota bacterium]MDD4693231.1 hypothetical protein [Bacillota bacterium]
MLSMLNETLSGRKCLLCDKPQGFLRLPICRPCLKKLPPCKRLSSNLFIVFTKEVKIPFELVPGLAASRFYLLGGKTNGVYNKEDNGLSASIAWHLRVPLTDHLYPQTLVVGTEYKGNPLLDSLQYLYLQNSKNMRL